MNEMTAEVYRIIEKAINDASYKAPEQLPPADTRVGQYAKVVVSMLWNAGFGISQLPSVEPTAEDTAQIDDQVQDVLTTIVTSRVQHWHGVYIDPDGECMGEIMEMLIKDLATIGIVFAAAPIGGE